MTEDNELPLSGLVVIDMSQFLSGPYCSLRLMDLGARVIKVERPDGGDLSRRLYLSDSEIGNDSTIFHAINRSKESFAVDLKNEDDMRALKQLVSKADVLIQNFRPGVIERLGLHYDAVKAINARLVYASISGYGDEGPWVKRPGQDLLAQSRSGLMWLNGDEEQGPVPFGLAVGDMLAGAAAAQGILAALVRRGVTGRGGLVETSLLEALVDFQVEVLTTHLNSGRKLPVRSSFRSAHAYLSAPYGVYPAKDGYLAIAMTPIAKLAELLSMPELGPYRDDPSKAFTARDDIKRLIAAKLATGTVDEWLAILEPADIWCAKVLNWQELLASDGFQALDMLQTVTRGDDVSILTTRSPVRVDGARPQVERAAPMVGEHNDKSAKSSGWNRESFMTRITNLRVFDLRFPTSQSLDGSDAMNPDPDYSAAYVILDTDKPGLSGHGLTFTIGRGNDICCMAIKAMSHLVVGTKLSAVLESPGKYWRHLTSDSQLRWIGPEKGAMHLATGAVVNAVWDLLAKEAGKPVWRLVAEMDAEHIADIVDYRYLTDVLTRDEAVAILKKAETGKAQRIATLEADGYACYTTSAGWLGYDDAKLRRLCQEAIDAGFNHVKMKVGRDLEDDIRRLTIAREVIGPDRYLMIDANQVWEVGQAIEWVNKLAFAKPFFIEEPTSPDDVAGHRKIRQAIGSVKVATGEMCQNRIMFKQFIAEGAIDIVQIDSCRMGGLNEVLAVLLVAAKYGLPVWPHAGGVGLCEYVQHLSMIDYVAVSGTKDGRVIEYVDHLHEHFIDPCVIKDAAYMPPSLPGFSIEMKPASIEEYTFRG